MPRLGRDAEAYVVSDRYFDLLGLRVRAGRAFGPRDDASQSPVAVISARAAARLWPDRPAVGHVLRIGRSRGTITIVGVVDDVREMRGGARGLSAEPRITLYFTNRQALAQYPEVLARGPGDPLELRKSIVDITRVADPALLIMRATTLASPIESNLLVLHVFGGVVGSIAASALLLSIIGIYGVVAFGIAQRTREIGIRIALGATANRVMNTVMLETIRFAAIGLGLGLLLAIALGRIVRLFLFGVTPLDPVAFASVIAGFGAVAMLASYLPARRVSRVDPLVALRGD